MKNLKKLMIFLGMIASSSCILSSQKSPATCWQSFTACFRPHVSAEDIDRARKQASLAKIRALQNSYGVAPGKFVREYTDADRRQASAIFAENGFSAEMYLPHGNKKTSNTVLVYEQDDYIKGVCSFMPEHGYIHGLSVGSAYKRQGIGSALVYAAMYDCKSNHDASFVSVMSSSDAKPFYGKLGFTFISDTGRRSLV